MEKIEHLNKQGKRSQTILHKMSVVYVDLCSEKTVIYKWYYLFKQGKESFVIG